MKRPLILIVDDEPANIEILDAALEDECDTCFAISGEDALAVARDTLPDLILLDILMPGMDGYETCRQIKADPKLADVPIIFTTGLDDQEAEIRGLALGAIDYITKPFAPLVVRARVHNHLELKRMRDELAELAVTDALTGLGNRRQLERSLVVETQKLSQASAWLSVIILDIDFFKQFNDIYGHPAGDRCIFMIAAALSNAVHRAAGLTSRYGGEEFACVLPGVDHEEAMSVAQGIRDQVQSLEIPHLSSAIGSYVTVSVGVATARCKDGTSPGQWLVAADRQLYLAKAAGRNSVVGEVFEFTSPAKANSADLAA